MQLITKLCRFFAWLTLIITSAVQVLAIVGIALNDSAGKLSPWYLASATFVMLAAVILFFALRRGKIFPLILSALAGIAFVVLALIMMQVYPVVESIMGGTTGLSLWDAILRHMTPLLIPIFLFPLWWQDHEERQAEKNAIQDANTPSYFDLLSDSDVMHVDDDSVKQAKPKRSVRNRMRKENEK